MTISQGIIPPVAIINNHVVTTSKAIAEFFNKRHDNILRTIESIKADCESSWYALNFEEIQNQTDLGRGRSRLDKAFNITKNGFVLLVMGFTGKQAMQFKIAYINRFDEMEARLKAVPEIPNSPHLALRDTIQAVAKGDRGMYKALYNRLYRKFQVTSYKELNDNQCVEAAEFIKSVQGEYVPRDKIEAPKPTFALADGQHYIVVKDGEPLYRYLLSSDVNDSCLKTMNISQNTFNALKKDLAHFLQPHDPYLQITYPTAQRALSMMIGILTILEQHGLKMDEMYQKLDYVKLLLTNYHTRLSEADLHLSIVKRLVSTTLHPTVVSGQGVKFS